MSRVAPGSGEGEGLKRDEGGMEGGREGGKDYQRQRIEKKRVQAERSGITQECFLVTYIDF